ncbi:MAG: UxaA family hydrolase [Akkermansiaceae bacterium]|jgi:hypothetical protein|nr:UxaA family hydrolase [Akkermansiaceae bacterium]
MLSAIRLFPTDNVMVLTRSLEAGETIELGDIRRTLQNPIGLGHKIAACAISTGEKILKYGAPIGSATAPIEPGEHIHLHNMKSDYLPTFTLDEGREFHHTA